MKKAMIVLFSFLLVGSCLGQGPATKWQVGTIMSAKPHTPAAGEQAPAVRYDVILRVANTEYVVLLTPPDGTLRDIVEYRLGQNGLVLVGKDSIKYNDLLGRTQEVPILSRRTIAPKVTENQADKKQ